MSYPRSPPQSPDDWKSRGMMSKTFSTSSRSTNPNSRSASMASSSGRSYNNINYESSARTYYVELRKYLISFLAKEAAEGVHPQRASARQKLSRLSNLQFHELAMDVYDELMRRNLNDKFVPFLAVREEFHPKRNQARQKLATLPDSRFKDLASDVYYELTRRYPHIMDADDTNRPPMPPIPTTSASSPIPRHPQQPAPPPASQATTIVPMKGTINVEPVSSKDSSDEDDDMDDHTQFSENSPIGKYTPSIQQHQHLGDKHTDNSNGGYQSKQSITPQSTISSSPSYYQQHHNGYGKQEGESLDSLMADLGNMVHARSQESDNNASTITYSKKHLGGDMEKQHVDDYEYQIATMTKRIQMLEQENQDLMARKGSRDDTDGGNTEKLRKLQNDYNRLDEQYRSLNRNHKDQQQMVHDVKQETYQLMNELEKLSNENDKLRNEKEHAESKNRQLLQEIQDWQTKYQKVRIELRNTNGSIEHEKAVPNQDIIKEHMLQPTRSGVISYDAIISYQAAIEDLLKQSRSKTPSDVLSSMKTLVVTCKSITEDVERYETKGAMSLDKQTKLQTLKGPFSNGLTHLVTAAKSHVNGMGISPVGLLDVAASNLTSAVVDLVKLVGMTSTSLSPATPTTTKATDSYHRGTGSPQKLSPSTSTPRDIRHQDTVGSPMSRMTSDNGNKGPPAMTPTQLAEYLKKETDQIVSNIQNLLSSLRSAQKIGDVYGIISAIVDVVTTVTEASRTTFTTTATGLRYRQQGDIILSDLQQCRDKLIQIQSNSFAHSPETASSAAKRDLAKESYEIAKFIKELIGLCES